MDEVLLRLLADGEYRSGEAMSRALGVTRAAVWKRMEALRAQGFQIESGGKRGYRLIVPEDGLQPPFLSMPGCELRYEESLPSTNATAAEMARAGAPHGTLVV
nr:HTH domain-containing protein [Clostridia bacterium]